MLSRSTASGPRLPGPPRRRARVRQTAKRPDWAAPSAASRSTADGIADYVERVVREFLADRAADETFAQWAHRADEEALQ